MILHQHNARKMLSKTSIISFLMLITFSVGGGKGFGESCFERWSLRTPSRLQSANVSFYRYILNGTPADIDDYPFKLSLRIAGMFFCGASVIGSKWALSAGHCLERISSPDLVWNPIFHPRYYWREISIRESKFTVCWLR